MLKEEKILGVEVDFKRYDIGDIEGWLKANVELEIENIEGFKDYLKELCK